MEREFRKRNNPATFGSQVSGLSAWSFNAIHRHCRTWILFRLGQNFNSHENYLAHTAHNYLQRLIFRDLRSLSSIQAAPTLSWLSVCSFRSKASTANTNAVVPTRRLPKLRRYQSGFYSLLRILYKWFGCSRLIYQWDRACLSRGPLEIAQRPATPRAAGG